MSQSLQDRYRSSPLFGANAPYIEELYEAYQRDPAAVAENWRQFFAAMAATGPGPRRVAPVVAHRPTRPLVRPSRAGRPGDDVTEKQAAVARLIQVYSQRGHQIADLDPLGLAERRIPDVLKPESLGLGTADMDTAFFTTGLASTGGAPMRLRDILTLLQRIYSSKVGADFAHVSHDHERQWLRERFEQVMLGDALAATERRQVLAQLTAAEGIERYLHTRYVGQKRFSLEGGDTLIPMLDDLIQQSGVRGVQEIVIGMAHRGRINVLVNVLGKAPQALFHEFEGKQHPGAMTGSGDVKYHMGFSSDIRTPGGNVHVVLAFNPSHLEIVNPVVEGSVRARQDRRGDAIGAEVLPVLIHGDAAFACQGVVAETLQLSQTRGFATGGTVHLIVNNQVGFTISDRRDARSTPYCSDIAKMVEAPVFHVNGDDPEAAVRVTRLALDYRQAFRKDIVIDLVCYRRHGHNEADEPAATQPKMYQVIRKHPTTRQIYLRGLIENGVIEATEAERLAEEYRERLDLGQPLPQAVIGMIGNPYTVDWGRYRAAGVDEPVDTAITKEECHLLGQEVIYVPAGFSLHPQVARIMQDRARMAAGELPVDWGFAEMMAYASLLKAGFRVRMTGQDSRRGTFFHRHAVLHDQSSGETHVALGNLSARQHAFTVTDSLLSEEAVLGFEYGYATTDPQSLVIWEAQFGDFANGAQVVIDQFISSGEAKWGRLCGLVLFLPHGQEGQGPEHSSARLERFLQLCAELNMQVCVPSTPAQIFHLLRRQMLHDLRKPLVVMTPKSLLRHRLASSPLADLCEGRFRPVIQESDPIEGAAVRRVVLCSGKVYYDLLEARRGHKLTDVAIVRIEQLYPFPAREFAAALERFPLAKQIVWCQEEPQNQGAWFQIRHRLQEPLSAGQDLFYAGRAAAAAPAPGVFQVHLAQQQGLVSAALGIGATDDGR